MELYVFLHKIEGDESNIALVGHVALFIVDGLHLNDEPKVRALSRKAEQLEHSSGHQSMLFR